MTSNATAALADFLEAKARDVKSIENTAMALLSGQPDQDAYQAKMREKAELLAALAEDAESLVAALAAPLNDAAALRLEQFSQSASNSLRIGSVFYMSALLYPDDHKQGDPNNLELFAAEVRSWV